MEQQIGVIIVAGGGGPCMGGSRPKQFTMLGGLSPCRSAYSNRDISEQYPWLSTARKSFPTAQRRSNSTYYQNFSELQLETILAAHVQQAVLGVCSPEEALKQAQDCLLYTSPSPRD